MTPGEDDSAQVVVFEIRPEGGSVTVGDFRLDYDSNAVCDPETSGYGPLFWSLSCSTLAQPVTITARFWTANGERLAEFSPDVRFSPSANVIISAEHMVVDTSSSAAVMFADAILYWKEIDGIRFYLDEAWFDSDLVTTYSNGRVSRRVKHFSGYLVSSGECEGENPPPECQGGGGQ